MQSHGALVIVTVEANSQLMLQLVKNNNMSTGEGCTTKAAYFRCLVEIALMVTEFFLLKVSVVVLN